VSTKPGQLQADGAETFAVCLLWSFRNPVHEEQLAAILAEEALRGPSQSVACR
jgi:N-methylhydantoinase A/oxoprolinase/acetone carboxylase beta subunit